MSDENQGLEIKVNDSYWDIFKPSEVNHSTVEKHIKIVDSTPQTLTDAGGTDNITNVYSLRIRDINDYHLLSQFYLRVQFKLVKDTDGTALGAGDVVTLINHPMNLFSSAEWKVEGKSIKRVNYPGVSGIVQGLVKHGLNYSQSAASGKFWHPDTLGERVGGEVDIAINPTTVTYGSGAAGIQKYVINDDTTDEKIMQNSAFYNEGYRSRFLKTKESGIVEAVIPLDEVFGFMEDMDLAIRGVSHELELVKNNQYSWILHGQGARTASGGAQPAVVASTAARTVITKLQLYVSHVEPSVSAGLAIEQQMHSGQKAVHCYEAAQTYISDTYAASPSSRNITWKIASINERVTGVYIACQHSGQFETQNDASGVSFHGRNAGPNRLQINNGGTFSYLDGIDNIEVKMNGKQKPQEAYSLDFNNNIYLRAYQDYLDAWDKFHDSEGACISYEEYKYLYPIFFFDFSQEDVKGNGQVNDLECRITCTSSTNGFRMYAVVLYEDYVTISSDQGRLVLENGA